MVLSAPTALVMHMCHGGRFALALLWTESRANAVMEPGFEPVVDLAVARISLLGDGALKRCLSELEDMPINSMLVEAMVGMLIGWTAAQGIESPVTIFVAALLWTRSSCSARMSEW